MQGTIEIQGPKQIIQASEQLLEDPDTHIVLVRGFVTQQVVDSTYGMNFEQSTQLLEDVVPEYTELGKFVTEWWQNNGYNDFSPTETGFHCTKGVTTGKPFNAHTDLHTRSDGSLLRGVLSLSLANRGEAKYTAAKPKNPLTDDVGNFDPRAWKRLARRQKLFCHFSGRTVVQHSTDAVLTTQHPRPSVHKLEVTPNRSARLYDLEVERLKADY